jgi:putative transposase
MLTRPKRKNILKSMHKLLEIGRMPDKLSLERLREDIGGLKLNQKMSIKPNMSTPESLQKSKSQIYSDRLNILKGVIQITKLSKILDQDLTSNDKVSEEFWRSYSAEISKRLWLPLQTDFQGLEQKTSSNGSLSSSEQSLLYSTTPTIRIRKKNSLKTLWKLLPSSQPDITEEENIIKKSQKKSLRKNQKESTSKPERVTRKIRIYPNKEMIKQFKINFQAHNYFYNKAIEHIKSKEVFNMDDCRKKFIPRNSELTEENMWMKAIPLDVREYGAQKALDALTTSKALLEKGLITEFNLQFRSKKYSTNIFYAPKKALIDQNIFIRKLKKNSKLRCNKRDEKFLKESHAVFSVIQGLDKKYYICVLTPKEDTILTNKLNNICALDPGVRTFLTLFADSLIGELGYNTSKILYGLYKREDRLKSILATKTLKSHVRYALKHKCALLRTKIKHIVDDLHWKMCNFLTKNFQVILLPIFNTKNMSNKKNRKISKTTTRLLLGLRHYDFQQKLIWKAKQRGRTVILCKEHYTTKCCSKCGELNHKIGSKKIFQCEACDITIDRDINAARNILIRGITLYLSDEMPSCEKGDIQIGQAQSIVNSKSDKTMGCLDDFNAKSNNLCIPYTKS